MTPRPTPRPRPRSAARGVAVWLGLLAVSGPAAAERSIIAGDDFDPGGLNPFTFSSSPNLSISNGLFPGSPQDVFGILSRATAGTAGSRNLVDSTAAGDFDGSRGLLPSTKLDRVFAVEDLGNSANPSGLGSATWTFRIGGAEQLELSLDMAAWGDFETADDGFNFVARIDDQPTQVPLFIVPDEAAVQTYTFESGAVAVLGDPLTVHIPGQAPQPLDNTLRSFTAPITGTGSLLTLTLNAANNGGSEVFAFDNLVITGLRTGLPGDFDNSGTLDAPDLDLLLDAVTAGSNPAGFDLTADNLVTLDDRDAWVLSLFGSAGVGDVNLDGYVDILSDFSATLTNLGQPAPPGGFTWTQGDLDGDGEVTVLGDVSVILAGLNPTAATSPTVNALPEPAAAAPLAVLLLTRRRVRLR